MPGSILLGYDGSPSAAHAIRRARAVLAARTMIVATVWEPALPVTPTVWGDGLADPIDPAMAEELTALSGNRAEQLARHGAEIARAAGFAVETAAVPEELNIADTLADLAAERGADAIVVGRRGHGRLHQLVLGSTSASLLRRAGCPVLVVPMADDAED